MFSRLRPAATVRPRNTRRKLVIENLEAREVPAAFSPGNLAILQAPASANNTTASIVELDEATAAQTPTNVIAIDGTGANAIRISSSATSTAYLSRSADGSLLTFNGANSANTTANVNTLNPRGVATLDATGNFAIQTTYTGGSGNQTRSSTSLDNTNWFIADQGGVYTNNATAASPTGNLRAIRVFGGTVYTSTASGTATNIQVVTVSAPTGGTLVGLPGLTNNAAMQDFYLISSGDNGAAFDVLYTLSATSNTAGTVAKYSFVDTDSNSTLDTWQANGTYTTTFGGFGLAAADNGNGAVLYATTGLGALTANSVLKLADTAGYNTAINITTASNVNLYTAPTGAIIKGVDFAPIAANLAPTVPTNTGLTLNEGATATIDAAKLTAADDADSGVNLTFTVGTAPANGALKKGGTTLAASDTFTQTDIDNSLITYVHNGGETTSDSFTFTVKDSQGKTSASQTFTIAVNAVDDAPTLTTNAGLSGVVFNTAATITNGILLVSDVDNTPAQITFTVGTAPTGTLKKNGTTLNATDTFTQADINDGLITYTAPASGSTDSFVFTVSSGPGSIGDTTFNITLSAGNTDPTVAANTGLTLAEGATATVTTAKLQVTDAEQNAASLTYTVGTIPANGALKKNGTTLAASDTFTQADIDNNLITYVHDAGETTADSFVFTVADGSGGTLSATTFNITVTAVNDTPVLAVNAGLTVAEGATATVIGADKLSVTDVDNTAAQTVFTVTAVPAGGTLAKNGTALGASDTFTQADVNNDLITYAHAGGEAAADNFKFTVSDGAGGTIAETTFAVTVTAVNDDPTITINRTLVLNPGQSVAISNAILLAADADSAAALLAYAVTTGPTKGTVTKAAAPVSTFTQNDLNAGDTTANAIRYTATSAVAGDTDTIVLTLTDGTSTPLTVTINISVVAPAAASFTGNYSQTFDNLLPTPLPGNNSSLPAAMLLPQGWLAAEVGGNASNSVRIESGTQSTGDSYFYGAVTSNERALGTQASGSNSPVHIGVALTNDTGATITDLDVAYVGEQWRKGGGAVNVLVFDYSTDATSLTAGTYTAVTALDFTAPEAGANGPLDGNAAANQAAVSGTITGLSLAPGATIYLRWTDTDSANADDGMAIDTVSIRVPGNTPPAAVADSYSTAEDAPLTVVAADGVLDNDTDADSDPLTAVLVDDVDNGTLVLNADGAFVYTPDAEYSGADSFTYKANDGTDDSNTVAVTITVTAVNDAPAAVADSYTVAEDGALTVNAATGVLANDTDAESNPLTAALVTNVSNGTLALASDGSFTYTPTANFSGTDSFTYKANDGLSDSNTVTVTITVNAVNDVPVAVADSYSVGEDGTLTVPANTGVLANDTDADADTLSAALVSNVSNGALALAADGSFVYTPNANFSGTDSFAYKANDGTADSNTVAVTITVNAAPDAPVAVADSYSVAEDGSLTVPAATGVLANDTDAESDPLTAALVTNVSNGALALAADGSFTYTPAANFSGTDSFTYKANDGTADSNTVTVTISVSAAADAPVAVADSYSIAEDGTLTVPAATGVLANDTDIDGDALTAALVSNVSNGTLALAADGSFTYTPAANFSGTDSFTYKANDGTADSNTVTVTITVNAAPDAPVAVADSYSVAEDGSLTVPAATGVLANDTDAESDLLTAALVTNVSNGTLALAADGSFTYTPAANFSGTDAFTYKANDATADSNTVTVTITVNAGADAPAAVADSYSVAEDGSLTVPAATGVLANDTDADADTLSAALVSNVSNGALALAADGSFVYTPAANFSGTDSFTYKANDGTADSNTVAVTITVTAVNDAPAAVADSYSVAEDGSLTVPAATGVLANDTDAESDPLTAALVTNVSNGALALAADGSFIYTPAANFSGTDSFTYKATDGTADSNTVTVSITVTAGADAPVAVADTYVIGEDGALTVNAAAGVLANDTDVDGDTLTAALVTDVSNGTLALAANGSFTYTPAANFSGTDSFTYKANDGTADSNTVTVTITVTAVPDAPVAVADSYSVAEDGTLTRPAATGVLANDTDADGNLLTAVKVTNPASGTVTLNADGSFVYTPNPNFSGTDSFTYKANDDSLDSNTVTVTIAVTSVNDAPVVAVNGGLTVDPATTTVITAAQLSATDADNTPAQLVYMVTAGPANGTLRKVGVVGAVTTFTQADVNDALIRYENGGNGAAADAFSFTVTDGNTTTAAAVFNITVSTGLVVSGHPQTQVVAFGQEVSFSASAAGSTATTRQWQVSIDGGLTYTNIAGATAATLKIVKATAVQDGNLYRAVFTNTAGQVATTSPATLTVLFRNVSLMAAPQTLAVRPGTELTLVAQGNATTATRQWQVSTDKTNYANVGGPTNAPFTVPTAAGDVGTKYYRAKLIGATEPFSGVATVIVVAKPTATLTSAPTQTVLSGKAATFSASTSTFVGVPKPTVQWQVSADGGASYANIATATRTTHLPVVTGKSDGNLYRAVFTSATGQTATAPARLTVTSKPVVTLNPKSKTAIFGTTVTLVAQAKGSSPATVVGPGAPTTVQWYVKSTAPRSTFVAISGATSPTYSFTATAADNGKQYMAVFANSLAPVTNPVGPVGGVRTLAAKLTVIGPPIVSLNPVSKSVKAGLTAVFTAGVTGLPAATVVRWEVSTNGGNTYTTVANSATVRGATTKSLSVSRVTVGQSGTLYRAVFTNSLGVTTTAAATLTVTV